MPAGKADLRHSLEGWAAGDERAKLAIDVFVHRVRKYLGAYFLDLGGDVDAIVFSAGGPCSLFFSPLFLSQGTRPIQGDKPRVRGWVGGVGSCSLSLRGYWIRPALDTSPPPPPCRHRRELRPYARGDVQADGVGRSQD